jgi:hypothetical protein
LTPIVPVMPGEGVPIDASPLGTAVGAVEPPSAVPVPVGTALGAATAEVGAAPGAALIGVAVGLPALLAPEVSQAVATTTNNNNSKDANTGDFLRG